MKLVHSLLAGIALAAISTTASAGQIFLNEADFLAASGPLAGFEDFDDANVAPGDSSFFLGPVDSTTSNAALSPGDIAVGVSFRDDPLNDLGGGPSDGLGILGAGSFGAPTNLLVANNFPDALVIDFSVAVTAVALDIWVPDADPASSISIFGGMGELLNTTLATTVNTDFFGFISSGELIERIVIQDSLNEGQGVDNVRFGVVAVSEPASLALLGLGLAGMGIARRRKA